MPWQDDSGNRLRDWTGLDTDRFSHPGWRSTGSMRRNPWFAAEVLPALRAAVAASFR